MLQAAFTVTISPATRTLGRRLLAIVLGLATAVVVFFAVLVIMFVLANAVAVSLDITFGPGSLWVVIWFLVPVAFSVACGAAIGRWFWYSARDTMPN